MNEKHKIASNQIKALTVTVVVGVGILSLPSKMAIMQGNDGWLPIILGGLLIIPLLIIINKIFELYPDKDFFEIGREVLGKWVFNIFIFILLGHFIILAALITRHLGEIVKAFLLLTTPIEVIILTFIIAISYLARSERHVIGRAGYHIYLLIISFIIVVSLVLLIGTDFTNIFPVFQSDFKKIPRSIGITFFSYSGFETLILFLPHAEDKKKTLRASLIGIGIVILIYTIIFVISLSQFGLNSLKAQTFPTLSVIQEVDVPGLFIENLDGLVMAIWILIVGGTMGAYYYSAGKVLSNLLKTKTQELYIIPLLPIIYIVSLMPENVIQLDRGLGAISDYTGIFSMIIMPIMIYGIGYYKVRRAKQ